MSNNDYLGIAKQVDDVKNAYSRLIVSTGIIAFILGLVLGSIIHDWLYNHAH